jgi:hypothetical protein
VISRVLIRTAGLSALALLLLPSAGVAHRTPQGAADVAIRHLSPQQAERFPILGAKPGAQAALKAIRSPARARATAAATRNAALGEVRNWLALDLQAGYYRKQFTLRAEAGHVEIWVASELNVPAPARGTVVGRSSGVAFLDGDCRNDARAQITDEQVRRLASEFEGNMYPKESAAFSIPPARTGARNRLSEVFSPPEVAQFQPQGPGEHVVVLVDNVRDENFYDFNNVHHQGYIAGFFSPALNEIFDRNVLTIDGFDWLHRTGANPPDEPIPGDFCRSAPARPYTYEGTVAHEYQHLLEFYEDPDETNWVNEGLSDWAQTLTGYVHTERPITDSGFDSHIQCFLGWLLVQTPANPNPQERAGPENSLTVWVDQSDEEILCDYGATYSMMEFLAGRYGTAFMSALHRADGNGLAGLQQTLRAAGRAGTSQGIVRDWALMAAVDGLLDSGGSIRGAASGSVSTPTLNATINWDSTDAYSSPGAPPNGSDYIRLRNRSGGALTGRAIRSISFNGENTHRPGPIRWRVDPGAPDRGGNPALYSGSGDERDEAIVRSVAVSRRNPTLVFDARWNLEAGYDYAFVQVSTNGGRTYRSLDCESMEVRSAPDAIDEVKRNLPGYNGVSPGWVRETCGLGRYAGKKVLLSFRVINDPFVLGNPGVAIPPGFWADNVRVSGRLISNGNSLRGWRSPTQVRALRVAHITVRLLSITTATNSVTVRSLALNKSFDFSRARNLSSLVDPGADVVAAIVTYDEPNEKIDSYARYRLIVNGVRQPGGT